MIKSMTGFGRGEVSTEIGRFIVEIKSVNSRTCNITVKFPDTLSSLEIPILSYIKSRISRGQVNISVDLRQDGVLSGKKVILDRELAREYCKQLSEVREYLSLTDTINLGTIAALPGVVNIEEAERSADEIWHSVNQALTMAVDQLMQMKEAEGAAMLADISNRLETMSQLAERIKARAPDVVEEYRQRLRKRIGDLTREQVVIDESRLALEVAVMAERCDISEEIVRIQSHLSQMKDCLKDSEPPVGRHLDFVLQEINREVNTIASKAGDFQISADCIRFKDEIEKIREQVQNIE